MVVLYHYTTYSGSVQIESSKRINCAVRHALKGPGVYFTAMSPHSNSKLAVAKNNYHNGGRANLRFVDYVVEVTFPASDVSRCSGSRDLWRYPDKPVDLTKYTYSIYQNPGASPVHLYDSDSDDGGYGGYGSYGGYDYDVYGDNSDYSD